MANICLILVTLVSVAFGEVFYIRSDGIYNLTARFFEFDSPNRRASLCYNGRDFYYTTEGGTIDVLSGGENKVVKTTTSNEVLANVACCCDILTSGIYHNDVDEYVVWIDFLSREVSIEFKISEDASPNGIVCIDCERGILYVIGRNYIWAKSINDPTADVIRTPNDPALDTDPRCCTFFTNSSGVHFMFVSFAGTENIGIIELSTGKTSQITVKDGDEKLLIYCITVENGTLYGDGNNPLIITSASTDVTFFANAQDVISGNTCLSVTVFGNAYSTFVVSSFVNGIVSCRDCETGCLDANCTACDDGCGFCSPDTGECICENSAVEECIYKNKTIADQCLEALLVPDAFCIVQYPLAKRRVPPSIVVLGYSNEPANIYVGRRVKTGRWPITVLPNPREYIYDNNGVVGPSYKGFRAPVPDTGSGRRFGVYYADIKPFSDSYRDDRICCLVTENSGFYNKYYTYTRSIGDVVTFWATLNKRRFRQQLRWGYTSESAPSTLVDINRCDRSLHCEIDDLSKDDQGVYQVYRAGRYLRTWHPIFYLFVRCCREGYYGADCDRTCDHCVKGVCDDVSGECICYAGWTGDYCDTACLAGLIGQNCDTKCDGLFEDGKSDNCENLLICLPGKTGCSCYSGLEPPECSETCEYGTWGPNCAYDCNPAPCDPRTGV